jgi:uncharacterized delta-60 repeat protein
MRTSALPLLFMTASLLAKPGDLDPSFGEGGRVFVDFVGDTDAAATVILQPDGKLLVGRANDATDDDFSIVRLNADGSLDPSFGRDGRTTLDVPGVNGTAYVVLRQADGRIVAAGTVRDVTASDDSNFGLARYNEDGSVDASFGVDGVVTHDLGGRGDAIHALVQQADGRLVAAGRSDGGSNASSDMALVRFESNGSVDRSFGANGVVVVNFYESNGYDELNGLVQQSDGALLAAGSAAPSNPYTTQDIALLRLLPGGTLDPSFGDHGRLALKLSDPSGQGAGSVAAAGAVTLAPDGKIVLSGSGTVSVWDYGVCAPLIARLNADGTPDVTFGIDGTAWIDLDCAYLRDLAIAPDGGFYAAGTSYHGYGSDHIVARVTSTGQLDPAFGFDGVAVIDVGDGDSPPETSAASLIVDASGNILTVSSTTRQESADVRVVVARLLADGSSYAGRLGFIEAVSALEGERVSIPVRRTGGSTGTVSVEYTTRGGSASSGLDFAPSAGMLTWDDGDWAAKTIAVSIVADAQREDAESFRVELSHPSGGADLAANRIEVAIADNSTGSEPPPVAQSPSEGGGGSVDWLLLAVLLVFFAATTLRSRERRLNAHRESVTR